MPLPVPKLDDRTFADLVSEGRSLVPRYAPRWTNHNASDPGIALLELFAFLTETTIYQLDQIPDEAIRLFLELMAACPPPGEPLDRTVRTVLGRLAAQPRAVTVTETTTHATQLVDELELHVARAEAAAVEDPACDNAPATLVATVPQADAPAPFVEEDDLYRALKQRVLLGTRLHVARAPQIAITITTTIVRRPGSGLDEDRVRSAIRSALDPATWPLGRAVYRSELYQLLERLPEVDHVLALELEGPGGPLPETDEGIVLPAGAVPAPPTVHAAIRDTD